MSDCLYPSFQGQGIAPAKPVSTLVSVGLMMGMVATAIGYVGYSFGRSVEEGRAAAARYRPDAGRSMVVPAPVKPSPMKPSPMAEPSPAAEPVSEAARVGGKAQATGQSKVGTTFLQVAAVKPAGQRLLVERLVLRGYPVRVSAGPGHTVRVLVGPVQSVTQMETLVARLARDGYPSFRKQL